jgi:hypothetical protein
MFSECEMDDSAAVVGEEHEHEQHAAGECRHGEEKALLSVARLSDDGDHGLSGFERRGRSPRQAAREASIGVARVWLPSGATLASTFLTLFSSELWPELPRRRKGLALSVARAIISAVLRGRSVHESVPAGSGRRRGPEKASSVNPNPTNVSYRRTGA